VTVVDLVNEEAFLQQNWRDTVVVVDGYQFDEVFWQRLMATHPRRTVCIDDFRGIPYLADIVVCYNEGVEAQQFQLAPNTRLFLGGRYMLLRPEILAAALSEERHASRRAIMIAAGGTNQESWVADMLSKLGQIEPVAPLWVLSGRRLAKNKVLHRSGLGRSRVRFFSGLNASAMILRYRQTRYLITPASTIMLEAFTAGCPMISGWIADNQRNSLEWYARQGLIVNAGDLRQMSREALNVASAKARSKLSQMIRKQREYIMGSTVGLDQIVKTILAAT